MRKEIRERQNWQQILACGLTLQMQSTKFAHGELGLTTLRPEECIVQTGCMQLAAARVGHMQLRLAQWQRTSTKTYCGEHGYQQM
jgi:hypothetical protein